MALEMKELFYGEPEPTWIINNSRRMATLYTSSNVHYNSRLPAHEVYYDPAYYSNNSSSVSGRGPVVIPRVVELMVPMCCTKCEEKLREEILELGRGVHQVICDRSMQKVIVTGFVDPLRVLKKARRVKKRSQFWSHGGMTPSIRPLQSGIHTGSLFNINPAIKHNNNIHTTDDLNMNLLHQVRPTHDHQYADTGYRTAHYNRYPSTSGSYYFTPQNYDHYALAPEFLAHSPQFHSSNRRNYYDYDDYSLAGSGVLAYTPQFPGSSTGYYDVITNPKYLKHIESESWY